VTVFAICLQNASCNVGLMRFLNKGIQFTQAYVFLSFIIQHATTLLLLFFLSLSLKTDASFLHTF